jgi:transcription antitermination protein NusB
VSGDTGGAWDWARQARAAALQMLYQWEVGRLTIAEVAGTFWRIGEIETPPSERAQERAAALASGTVEHLAVVDRVLEDASKNWRLERMPVIDRLILRMGIYELMYETGTPPAVVIDEALELARRFSTDEAVPFINGVLDAVKGRVERGEVAGDPGRS